MLIFLPLLLFMATANCDVISVILENGKYRIRNGVSENWIAKANFTDETFTTGWSYLEVGTNASYPDEVQARAAGMAEGFASHDIIYNSWRNTFEGFCKWQGEVFCKKLNDFLKKNFEWMNRMIVKNADTSDLWHQVELILQQLRGMVDGYNLVGNHQLSSEEFILINLSGDLEDLEAALKPRNMTDEEWAESGEVTGDGRCSALIKVLPLNVDLLVSHVTWNTYQSMLRILKKYTLPFRLVSSKSNKVIPGLTVSFSSYPGFLHSGDDYYILSSGLVSLETTIGNSNPSLWKNVKPEGELMEWIRVIVANRLSRSGKTWSNYFAQYNSGTYNNQWMVVDYKRFRRFQAIKTNTLWVTEQLPGLVVSKDKSQVLRKQNYWPSYNVPAYPVIFNLSGNQAMVNKYGDWFTYDKTPRALIFKRDQKKITNLSDMIKLMRYNNFQHDSLSKCNCTPPYSAENAISARNDLNPKNGSYPFAALGHRSHGGTDMKITTAHLATELLFLAINGPTYDQQPVFQWSKQDFANNTPHYGHPDAWKFPLIQHKWIN